MKKELSPVSPQALLVCCLSFISNANTMIMQKHLSEKDTKHQKLSQNKEYWHILELKFICVRPVQRQEGDEFNLS